MLDFAGATTDEEGDDVQLRQFEDDENGGLSGSDDIGESCSDDESLIGSQVEDYTQV
jgi:hypothetical protein